MLFKCQVLTLTFSLVRSLFAVYQSADDYVADGLDALEAAYLSEISAADKATFETSNDKFIEILRSAFEKNIDMFELYALRNVFVVNEDSNKELLRVIKRDTEKKFVKQSNVEERVSIAALYHAELPLLVGRSATSIFVASERSDALLISSSLTPPPTPTQQHTSIRHNKPNSPPRSRSSVAPPTATTAT